MADRTFDSANCLRDDIRRGPIIRHFQFSQRIGVPCFGQPGGDGLLASASRNPSVLNLDLESFRLIIAGLAKAVFGNWFGKA